MQPPVRPDAAREIARYDARDAADVCLRVRTEAGLEPAVDDLLAAYRTVMDECRARETDANDAAATAAYVRWLASSWDGAHALENRVAHVEAEHRHLQAAYRHLQAAYERLRAECQGMGPQAESGRRR